MGDLECGRQVIEAGRVVRVGLQKYETQAGRVEGLKGAVGMLRLAMRLYGKEVHTRRCRSKESEGSRTAGQMDGNRLTRKQEWQGLEIAGRDAGREVSLEVR